MAQLDEGTEAASAIQTSASTCMNTAAASTTTGNTKTTPQPAAGAPQGEQQQPSTSQRRTTTAARRQIPRPPPLLHIISNAPRIDTGNSNDADDESDFSLSLSPVSTTTVSSAVNREAADQRRGMARRRPVSRQHYHTHPGVAAVVGGPAAARTETSSTVETSTTATSGNSGGTARQQARLNTRTSSVSSSVGRASTTAVIMSPLRGTVPAASLTANQAEKILQFLPTPSSTATTASSLSSRRAGLFRANKDEREGEQVVFYSEGHEDEPRAGKNETPSGGTKTGTSYYNHHDSVDISFSTASSSSTAACAGTPVVQLREEAISTRKDRSATTPVDLFLITTPTNNRGFSSQQISPPRRLEPLVAPPHAAHCSTGFAGEEVAENDRTAAALLSPKNVPVGTTRRLTCDGNKARPVGTTTASSSAVTVRKRPGTISQLGVPGEFVQQFSSSCTSDGRITAFCGVEKESYGTCFPTPTPCPSSSRAAAPVAEVVAPATSVEAEHETTTNKEATELQLGGVLNKDGAVAPVGRQRPGEGRLLPRPSSTPTSRRPSAAPDVVAVAEDPAIPPTPTRTIDKTVVLFLDGERGGAAAAAAAPGPAGGHKSEDQGSTTSSRMLSPLQLLATSSQQVDRQQHEGEDDLHDGSKSEPAQLPSRTRSSLATFLSNLDDELQNSSGQNSSSDNNIVKSEPSSNTGSDKQCQKHCLMRPLTTSETAVEAAPKAVAKATATAMATEENVAAASAAAAVACSPVSNRSSTSSSSAGFDEISGERRVKYLSEEPALNLPPARVCTTYGNILGSLFPTTANAAARSSCTSNDDRPTGSRTTPFRPSPPARFCEDAGSNCSSQLPVIPWRRFSSDDTHSRNSSKNSSSGGGGGSGARTVYNHESTTTRGGSKSSSSTAAQMNSSVFIGFPPPPPRRCNNGGSSSSGAAGSARRPVRPWGNTRTAQEDESITSEMLTRPAGPTTAPASNEDEYRSRSRSSRAGADAAARRTRNTSSRGSGGTQDIKKE
ncbi:unnamed protein product [Amoebophrya sp. A120]|nr:unnamed protein product [Amoebophrya sp. A120]|eukprot:GSA120T00025270001.1